MDEYSVLKVKELPSRDDKAVMMIDDVTLTDETFTLNAGLWLAKCYGISLNGNISNTQFGGVVMTDFRNFIDLL